MGETLNSLESSFDELNSWRDAGRVVVLLLDPAASRATPALVHSLVRAAKLATETMRAERDQARAAIDYAMSERHAMEAERDAVEAAGSALRARVEALLAELDGLSGSLRVREWRKGPTVTALRSALASPDHAATGSTEGA